MASITIRNLDEETKRRLRERAAANGRSMEEEARLALREAAEAHFPASAARDSGREEPAPPQILLIIAGGIAAYKSLELIRRLRERGICVRCVMTAAARHFVGEMAVGAVTGGPVFSELWDRAAEHDIGHIRLAREADLIVIAPATADLLAKLANGHADDLAGAVLLAASSPVLVAPAMNPHMWRHPATQRNVAMLRGDGVHFIGPETGEMAEKGEAGIGRMAEPPAIADEIERLLVPPGGPLAGLSAVVTSGPTQEPIDPVRYIANRSSGKQGHAIAAALARAGARVRLVSGPVTLPDPPGVETIHVTTAREMADAVERSLPVDIAVMVAAVADWRVASESREKMKKTAAGPPALDLVENPDILRSVGGHRQRPRLVIGFAAETNDAVANGEAKRRSKKADWILANDVSGDVMGGDENRVVVITAQGNEEWPVLSKKEVAQRLAERIAQWFEHNTGVA